MEARLLIVEDDAELARLVADYLAGAGFEVDVEGRGDRAVSRILAERPDLVVLDLMLPGEDGLSVCRRVRPAYRGAILMLTAQGDEVDEVVGLEMGADDYMAKPVRPRLLLARIRSLLRRTERKTGTTSGGVEPAPPVVPETGLRVGDLLVDPARREVELRGRPVALTTAEFDLLELLARHAGEVLTRPDIYRALRGIEYDGLDRSIDLRITRLRRKLGDDARQPTRIKSVRGVGYLLAAP